LTLRCFWKIISKDDTDSSVLLEKPRVIDDELFRLSVNALGSEKTASFAIKELLPLLTADLLKEATQIVIENYEHYKKEKQK
ncbi:MAG: metallophosphoesterase, partial [Nitrosopumilaceae archaeon]|nr:metallophosphoesterase [Nitrosopumilaceae archaeon]